MRADSLEKGLQSRPNPEELVKKGILEGTSTISSLVHVTETKPLLQLSLTTRGL